MRIRTLAFGRGVLLPILLLLLSTSWLAAQTNTTALNGTVTDAAGLKLAGATVTLQHVDTGAVTTLTSKAAGEYDATQIVPGHYKVTVEHDGFSQQQVEIDLLVATPQTLNFKLAVGDKQTIVVEAPMVEDTLNQTDATLGKAFDNQQVSQLPYIANNTLSLLALQPGVVSFDANNTTDARVGTINGARQDQTNITLDGTDNNDANNGYAFTGILRSTRDSIEEFRVTTSGANADAGRSSGGQVSLQTKGGTNQIHGSTYYYYRDPAMASNQWFNKQTELAAGAPNIPNKILQDTYGATLGLPIIKNKLFFFGAYEGYKQATNQVASATVPLGAGTGAAVGTLSGLRNGTLTYPNVNGTNTILTPTQIAQMDPNCTGTGSCPAGPGVDQAVVAFFNNAGYPQANTLGGDSLNTSGFSFVSPAPVSQITNIARIDYNINPKQILFVRGNLQSDNSLGTLPLPGGQPTSKSFGNSRGITAGHIWTLSHNMTNNFRYGWTRADNASRGAGSNYNSFAAVSLPFSTSTSSVLLEDTQDIVDDFTIVKGKHTIQFGINDRIIDNSRYLTKNLYDVGTLTANEFALGGVLNTNSSLDVDAFTTQLGVPRVVASGFASSYNSAVTAVAGTISVASGYANYSVANNSLNALAPGTVATHKFQSFEQEFYVQDQWKLMPKFTVTAGLRYEALGVPYEVNGQQVRPLANMHDYLYARATAAATGANYDPLIATGPGGKVNNAPGFWTQDKLDFAPRIAFNLAPDNKTSIRGGFAMTYDHFGQAAVDTYNDSYSFGLSSALTKGVQGSIDTAPRYTAENAVPTAALLNPAPAGGAFPITQIDGEGGISQTFDDSLRTPYAETFNLSVQREIYKGLTVTATYDGRLGRRQLMLRDALMPLNLTDPGSGETYFQAMTKLDKAYDANVAAGVVPNSPAAIAGVASDPYWSDLFPHLTCTVVGSGVNDTPTQAVYAQMARANETATLFALDVNGQLPTSTKTGKTNCVNPGAVYDRYYSPQYGSLYAQASVGTSNYNAGQLSIRHTVNRNIVYDFNYTFSKSMDTGSSPERSGGNTIINTWMPNQQYAPSTYDTRHNITADWVAALPFGHGQRFGASSSRLVDELLGGWQITGVLKYSSGFPWSSAAGFVGWGTNWEISSNAVQIAPLNTPGHHHYYAGTVAGAIQPVAYGLGLGTGVQKATSSALAAADFRQAYVGESGQRDNLRADGYFSLDPGISKSFRIREKQSFKLIVEYFNSTNALRFNSPGSGSTGSTFGAYTSLLNTQRQAQVAGRYTF